MFHNNIMNISETLNKRNLLKICLPEVTYPTDFCIICIHIYYGKRRKYFLFFNQWLDSIWKKEKQNKKKNKKKNDFLKYVENTVI